MLKYDGGRHANAGTCQVENDDSERVLGELTKQITEDG
jgi:nanoRNase/pAp phosphatase (c-di-AMP/oligoRNAs hydrolase)